MRNIKIRQNLIAALLCALLILSSALPALALPVYVYAQGDLNVRSAPNLNGKSLGTVYEGSTLDYAGSASVDDRGVRWYQVYYNDDTGWVSSRFASLGTASDDPAYEDQGDDDDTDDSPLPKSTGTFITATGNVNVRSAPRLSGRAIGSLNSGDAVDYAGNTSVDDRGVRWYHIFYQNTTGWVSSLYCDMSTDEGGIPSSAYTVRTFGDSNVRSKPSLSGSSLGAVKSGHVFDYAGSASVDDRGVIWYKVFYKDDSGWVSGKFSDLEGGASESAYVVATAEINVRTGPALSAKTLGAINNGDALVYADESSLDSRNVRWYKVYYQDDIGWVSSMYSELRY